MNIVPFTDESGNQHYGYFPNPEYGNVLVYGWIVTTSPEANPQIIFAETADCIRKIVGEIL